MPRSRDGRHSGKATSFTRSEVRAAEQLFAVLLRGGDARMIARSPHIRSVAAKFARMSIRLQLAVDEPDDIDEAEEREAKA